MFKKISMKNMRIFRENKIFGHSDACKGITDWFKKKGKQFKPW